MGGEVLFELTDTSYIEALWFVAYEQTDWMAIVFKDTAEGPWRARYRFRYYEDSEAFQSKDRKSMYEAKGKAGDEDTRARFVEAFEMMADLIAKSKHGKRWRVVVRGDQDKFERLLIRQPWAHVKVAPPAPETPQ